MNREVIRIEEPQEKPVEFTHILSHMRGWETQCDLPSSYDKVLYLGKCSSDGDMFAAYHKEGGIIIYKGHLNSGKY